MAPDDNTSVPPRRGHYFRRFLSYALSYKALLAIAIAMGVGKFGLNYVFPWLIGSAIDEVIAPMATGAQPTLEQRMHWLELLVGLGVVFSVFQAFASYGRGYFTAKLGNRVIADLRQDLFEHLHRLSLHFYSKERTGSIVSRLITDIQQASQVINGGIINVCMDSANVAIGLALLLTISWKLTLAGLAIMPLYAITFKVLNPRVKQASLRVQSQISKISGNVQERLAGIALVKTYAAERRESEKFQADVEEHYGRVLEQSTLAQLVGAISEGLIHTGTVIVVGLGSYLALYGEPPMSAGDVTKALGYLAIMYLPVRRFAEVNVIYQTSLAAIERVFQVFDITPKIVEKPAAAEASTPQRGEVRFQNVFFDYLDDSEESRTSLEERTDRAAATTAGGGNGAADAGRGRQGRRWVLEGVSFTVAPGERIALVGPSGGGKTTLVSLLPRLYDVAQGRILIDGIDVRDYRLRPLRRAIAIVQQDSFLFSGSVRENITYGRPKATDEQITAAARAANAHDFIMELPDGYNSLLGERGVNLSGGQKQRLSIARAILKDPRILILDEATSALDSESEALVQEALDRLMSGRTCFVIAHRLSTVRQADRILVLRRGRVIESGRHDELLALDGLYARLVRQQFGLAGEPAIRAG